MQSAFIILVNYNNHEDTLKCLDSIAKAGYGKNVVVVDNKSTVTGVDNIKERGKIKLNNLGVCAYLLVFLAVFSLRQQLHSTTMRLLPRLENN